MGELRELVERVWDAIELGDLDRLDDLCHPDVMCTMPGIGFSTLAATKQGLTVWMTAFPDLRHEVTDYVETDDKIAVELFISALHTGPLTTMGGGEIPPSWRPVVIQSTDVITVRDGKVSSWHSYFDTASILTQIETARPAVAAGVR